MSDKYRREALNDRGNKIWEIVDHNDSVVCMQPCTPEVYDGHARLGPYRYDCSSEIILKALNCHDNLLEACEEALTHIEHDEAAHGMNSSAGNAIREAISRADRKDGE